MDATHQRIYDEWVTAGRPGNKHPRALLEQLRRDRKAKMESSDALRAANNIEIFTQRICALVAPLRDEVSDSGRKAAFTREVVLARYRHALALAEGDCHEIMRMALRDAEQLWMMLPEEYR